MRALLAMAALCALVACSDGSRSMDPVLNRCTQVLDCNDGARCDPDRGICVRDRASVPYDYRLKITPTIVTDAGQLAVATTERTTLGDAGDLPTVVMARAVFVRGSVRAADSSVPPLEAELVFTPRDNAELGGARSVFTTRGANGQAYELALQPNLIYDVLVYPRGVDSERVPPFSGELSTGTGDQQQDFTGPVLRPLQGIIRDENGRAAPTGMRIKTRYRDRLLASSSIGTIAKDGSFAVWLPQAVLDAPADHVLVLELGGVFAPSNVQVAFDLSQAPDAGTWMMPVVPGPVLYTGSVENAELENQPSSESAVSAQLTFLSDFELPTEQGDTRDADWCQLKLSTSPPTNFTCSANVSTSTVGPSGAFAVQLLPGKYRIVVAPSSSKEDVQRLGTLLDTDTIFSQFNNTQGGPAKSVSFAPQFASQVVSPNRQPMPSVVVTANALNVLYDLPELARYNRSESQVSLYNGRAKLAVDVGVYDLVATPPAGSDFAWVLAFNRRIAGVEPKRLLPEFSLNPQYPVLLEGRAVIANREAVAEAEVDAYALVPNVEGGPDRAVRIAHTTTDSDGRFTLQMPPRIGLDEPADGGVDGGARDAGVADAQR